MRALVLVLFAAACGGQPADDQSAEEAAAPSAMGEDERAALENVRTVTAKYADVSAAIADGFIRDPSGHCVTAAEMGLPPEQGAMGVHYVHPARLGMLQEPGRVNGTDPALDWTQPEVLMYEPQADGTEKLVGVEYLVFRKAWEDAGNTAVPAFFSAPFDGMEDDPNTEADEAHEFMPHYELHVWTVRENPTGIYVGFNPAVSCEHIAAHTGHATGD